MKNTETTIEVYVELLDEGTDTWRPTQAEILGNGLYKLLPTSNYDPDDEIWLFLPGDIVRVEEVGFADKKKGLVARHPDPNVILIDVELEQTKGEMFWIRTTHALDLGEGKYKVLPTPQYNPQIQHWKFPPGSIVHLKEISVGGFKHLVPFEIAE